MDALTELARFRADHDTYFLWLLVFTGLVLAGVLIEEAESFPFIKKTRLDPKTGMPAPRYKLERTLRFMAKTGWIMLIFGVLGEGVFEGLVAYADSQIQVVSDSLFTAQGVAIKDLGDIVAKARGDAKIASDEAGDAKRESDNAKRAAAESESLARGARQEADGLESQITEALKQASEAEAHLGGALAKAAEVEALAKGYEKQIEDAKKDALEARNLLAEARGLASEAKQRSTEAAEGIKQIKAQRSLLHVDDIVRDLELFRDTEYMFVSVFQNEESINFLKNIDGVLQRAGWKRMKGPSPLQSITVFGPDDAVMVGFGTGILIIAEATDITALPPDPSELPPPLRAAVDLNLSIRDNTSPPDPAGYRVVQIEQGSSKVIRIEVGQKP